MKKLLILSFILFAGANLNAQNKAQNISKKATDTLVVDSTITLPPDTTVSDTLIDESYSIENNNDTSKVIFDDLSQTPPTMPSMKSISNGDYFEHFFNPVLIATSYQPKSKDSLGTFKGWGIEYNLAESFRDRMQSGPAYTRLYGKLSILQSSKKGISDLFSYSFGLEFSFESHPRRHFFIPYYGFELGGFIQKNFNRAGYFNPLLGLNLLYTKKVALSAAGGYYYPFSHFEELQGYYARLSLRIIFW